MAIPLRSLCTSEAEHNDRNYDMLVEGIIHDETEYTRLLVEQSRAGAFDANGALILTPEMVQLKAKLDWNRKLRDAIKAEKLQLQQTGNRYCEGQKEKAGHGRPKNNYEGVSRNELIKAFISGYPTDTPPSELWVPFKTALEEWSESECKESGKGDSRRYHYEIGVEKLSITFQTFRKAKNKAQR